VEPRRPGRDDQRDGTPATFVRDDGLGTEPPPPHKLVITPVAPVSGAFTVVVDYHGTPVEHVDTDGSSEGWMPTSDGATLLGQPIGSMAGFPNNDTPKDKATYTFTVEVPENIEVASNGELVSSAIAAGRRTWVWDQTRPMASELAMVSIGQYNVLESSFDLGGGRTVHEWSFVDASITNTTAINAERAQLSAVLTGLEGLFGPYPGGSTGIVVDDLDTGYALETQDRPFFPGGLGHGTFVHELTHQWYGDSVSPTEWNDLWINEGMATWAPVQQSGASTYTRFHGEWASTPDGSPDWSVPPAGITDTADLFGWQSYERGAMTYEALRTLMGDASFRTLIKQWQQLHHGASHGAADFQTLAEQVSGLDLDAFFQDWIHDPDKPAWPSPAPPPPPPPPAQGTFGAECQVGLHGKPRVGRTLTAALTGCPVGVQTTYAWFAGSKRIKGVSSSTYKIKRSKLGKRITARVTLTAPGYVAAERVSPPTRKVR
jgi:hypothetical protein